MEYNLDDIKSWLEVRFEQIDKRFEQIDKRFDKLEVKVDKLSDDHSKLSVSVAKLEEKVEGVNGRFVYLNWLFGGVIIILITSVTKVLFF